MNRVNCDQTDALLGNAARMLLNQPCSLPLRAINFRGKSWPRARCAMLLCAISAPAFAQSPGQVEPAKRSALVALALSAVHWTDVLPAIRASTQTNALAVVRQVAFNHAGTVSNFSNDTPFVALKRVDLPRSLRLGGKHVASLISQRDSSIPLGRDTLAIVIAVRYSSALGAPMTIVEIELYYGTSASIGGAQVWVRRIRNRYRVVKTEVSFLTP